MDRLIYLVRHGETEWNRDRRIQGQLDSPLTARGEDQARRVGTALAGLIGDGDGFDMVASPLGRARRSAEIIGHAMGFAAEHTADDRLNEMTWGAWDGLTLDEIEARDPGELARRRRDARQHWTHEPPGGESHAALAARVGGWLDDLAPGRRIVAITHGPVGRVLRGRYAGLSEAETLTVDEPQDAFFRLHRGAIERIDAAGR